MMVSRKTLAFLLVASTSSQVHGFTLLPCLSCLQRGSIGMEQAKLTPSTPRLHSSKRRPATRVCNLPRPSVSATKDSASCVFDDEQRDYQELPQAWKRVDQQNPMALGVMSAAWTLLSNPLPAEAAAGVVPSALWAYGHYLAMLLVMGSLVAERVLIKPQMSRDDEKALGRIDLVYMASLALLVVSGSLRAAEFAKGLDFYSHEILFWVKMSFVGVIVGCSLFTSITLLRRNDESPPMSDKLVARMTQVINAEISGIVIIPLVATFMARGVTYVDGFPWPAGAVLALITSGGACYFYGKQALTWSEDFDESKDTVNDI